MGTTNGPTTKLNAALMLEFEKNPAAVYRKLAEEAKTEETKTLFQKLAEKAERSRELDDAGKEIPKTPEQIHDAQLLAISKKLVQPSGWDNFVLSLQAFGIRALRSRIANFFVSLFSFLALAFSILVQFAGYCIVTLGAVYFIWYCARFGLGIQGLFGTIVLVILNIVLYCIFTFADDATESARKGALLIIAPISALIIWLFTSVVAITPSVYFTDYSIEEENLGVFVDPTKTKMLRVVYPDSNNVSEPGQYFFKAPNFLKERVEWYCLYPESIIETSTKNGNSTTITCDLWMAQRARAGTTLEKPLKSESEYRQEMRAGVKDILTECLKGDAFDNVKASRLIRDRFSNPVYWVRVSPNGFKITKSYSNSETVGAESEEKQ
jgi:hypothetical protein